MKNPFLQGVQEDILSRKATYTLFLFVFVATFFITVKELELFIYVIRLGIALCTLAVLVAIWLKLRSSRTKQESKIIVSYVVLFLLITGGALLQLKKLLL